MKETLLEMLQQTQALSINDIIMHLVVATVIGFCIYVSYKISHMGTVYSKKFNVSLVMLTILTATVMTVIGNNVALSLGMVGALSIVRFRTAVKEPVDTGFMFWGISAGIMAILFGYFAKL